jgi:sec-independent protein translocase protein TatB
MGTIDPAKILVVLVVALIVLGPEKLPSVARQAGKAWGDFRRFRARLETEVRGTLGEGPESLGGALGEIHDTLRDAVSAADVSTVPGPPDGARPSPQSAGATYRPGSPSGGPPPGDPSWN